MSSTPAASDVVGELELYGEISRVGRAREMLLSGAYAILKTSHRSIRGGGDWPSCK